MSVAIRVIACLDVADGRVVKGVNFTDLRDAGDPVELARHYGSDGIDELTFLDISASHEGRGTTLEVVSRTAEEVFIPLTVGGGVRSVEDVNTLLAAGADKVGVNTAAISNPDLIDKVAHKFGNQVLVLSVDARRCREGVHTASGFEVTTHGGRRSTGIDALEWVKQAQDRGVGEILLNSMDADGVQDGFDTEMIAQVCQIAHVPVIASGGAGQAEDFVEAVQAGAQAVLAASVFHYQKVSVAQVKAALAAAGFPVRGYRSE